MSYYYKDYGLQSHTKRARNHGSAHHGVHHWWMIRITCVLLLPLYLWFVISGLSLLVTVPSYDDMIMWVQNPLNATLLIALFVIHFYRAALDGQDIVLDYVKGKWTKYPALFAVNLLCAIAATVAIVSVIQIAF